MIQFVSTRMRQWRVCAASAARATILALVTPPLALAQVTVGVGATRQVSSDTVFSAAFAGGPGQLEMDGGTLRVSNGATGQALGVSMLNALLKRGVINNPYTQTGVSQLVFNGTTLLSGGPVAPFPADGMYIRASSFDSTGFQVINNGTFVQDGTGELTTQGPVQFNNRSTGVFDIRNNLGFSAGEFFGFKAFFNAGVFKKTGGTGASFVDATFYQDGGSVAVETGSLVFSRGGYHQNSSLVADSLGSNPSGAIELRGAHTFVSTVVTGPGTVILSPASTINLQEAGWDQRGTFVNSGHVRISEFGILYNSGVFEEGIGGSGISGKRDGYVFRGLISNFDTGIFSSNVAPEMDGFGNEIGRLQVVNRGRFSVNAGQLVQVNDFVNENGNVIVDGMVENIGGTFQLLGGALSGNGIINGKLFVGGGPGTAKFKPGSSPGTMTIIGPFSLLPGGVLELEVERDALTGAVRYDQVLAESFFLDGRISFLVGAGVTEADVLGLQFLDCGGACNVQYGGNLSYDFPGRPGSTLSLGPEGIQISALAPVPEPAMVAMLLAGMGVIGMATRRRNQSRPT